MCAGPHLIHVHTVTEEEVAHVQSFTVLQVRLETGEGIQHNKCSVLEALGGQTQTQVHCIYMDGLMDGLKLISK